jgi:hypothetical protein
MTAKSRSTLSRGKLLQIIQAPLAFYVLALLIVEAILGLFLGLAGFSEERKWIGFLILIGVFAGVVAIVTIFAALNPKNLLYGKEEHSSPQIDPSALHDQIEDIVLKLVKDDCLKK